MNIDNDFVESVAESLIREYLSRKGLRSTLQVMDQECPRRQGSISNRNQLAKELHITTLMNKNREQENPLRAMMEIMTKFFLEKDTLHPAEKPALNLDSFAPGLSSVGNSGGRTSQQPASMVSSNGDKYMTSLTRPATAVLTTRKGKNEQSQDVVVDDDLDSETLLGEGKGGLLARELSDDGLTRNKGNRPLSSKTRPGAIVSNIDDMSGRRRPPKPKTTHSNTRPGMYQQTYYPQEEVDINFQNSSSNGMTSPASGGLWNDLGLPQGNVPATNAKPAPAAMEPPPKVKSSSFQELLSAGEEKANQLSRRLSEKSTASADSGYSGSYSVNTSSIARDKPVGRTPAARPGPSSKAGGVKVGDLEFGDVDDLEEELNDVQLQPTAVRGPARQPAKQLDSKPIDTHTAIALKNLIFGSAMQDYNDEWKLQSFSFCDLPDLQYGIVQKKGGPCGVLAAVQAVVLQELLFGDNKLPQGHGLKPSRNERTKFLALALSRIFWRAGEQHRAVVAMPSTQTHVMGSTKFRQDDVTEKLTLYTFLSFSDVCDFMTHAVKQFETEGNPGVVLCMYSTVLSRGIDRVKKDMDEVNGTLMGRHGYCTQELVNLILTGEAVSNVFNDIKELDSGTGDVMVLRGVSARSDIGLLSLFEHYRSCEVGTYLKTPKYPIWVVCSESHFSVLFSTRRELTSDWKAERRFDLFYYDGLARQQEQIKLTIYTTSKTFQPPSEQDLVPPLEHCIRTKWEGAEIDWNDTEPLL